MSTTFISRLHKPVYVLAILLIFLSTSSCGGSPPVLSTSDSGNPPIFPPTLTPFQPLQPTAEHEQIVNNWPMPTATYIPPDEPVDGIPLWIDPSIPDGLRSKLSLPDEFSLVELEELAPVGHGGLVLKVGEGMLISQWVYAFSAPFASIEQGISGDELLQAWRGQASGILAGQPLLLSSNTLSAFSAFWGEPAAGSVTVVAEEETLAYAWDHQPAYALIPFESVEPRWKVLEIDGQSPLHKGFDLAAYPLTVPLIMDGDPQLVAISDTLFGMNSAKPLAPAQNWDSNKLTTLAMTGVTALVRATAYTMEQRGIHYPARDVGEILRSADITHISNEVPFAKNCPFPDPVQADMRFCSSPRYISLLEEVGTDIVELTGDHFQDYGAAAMYNTLDLYHGLGWRYYGGGANRKEARGAVILEHNGNRLAFIGCNAKGGGYAQASASNPGAVKCDYDWLESEIARLRSEGYLPIMTFQHFEYYTYKAQPSQVRDFKRLALAGAVIVSGSQAHQPQAFDFVDGAFIHYGLGNLFFDQFEVNKATRQGFIDRHVFYDGRHINTELLPIMFVDFARPRPMTPAEREELLSAVFRASGW